MQLSPTSRRYITISLVFFSIFWLFSNDDIGSVKSILQRPPKDIFDFPPVESHHIRHLCDQTQWNSSLVFTCENSRWGVGHVRNSILNCVRFAIAAGGSLVLPIIPRRDVNDETMYKRHGPGRASMDYMFDIAHFTSSLAASCPQLTILHDIEVPFEAGRRRGLAAEAVVRKATPTSGLDDPKAWRTQFYVWVDEHVSPEPAEFPMVIDLAQSFLVWPTHADGHHFAHDFGGLLKFRKDVRRLATRTLVTLDKTHGIGMQDDDDALAQYAFFGAHLRNAQSNSESFEGPTHLNKARHVSMSIYEKFLAQTTAYLEEASTRKNRILYIASGDELEIAHFKAHAKGWNMHVKSKYDLLSINAMQDLWWDQRAIIDWLVLTKAREMAGVGHSAFGWNVALQRHGFHHTHGDGHGRGNLTGDIWRDAPGKSTLYGTMDGYVESAGCMWP